MTLAELYRELEGHDWFHAQSDDPRVYEEGQRNWIKMFFAARKIEGGEQLFRDYSKHVNSGPKFGTPQHPKPERPKEQPQYVERGEP